MFHKIMIIFSGKIPSSREVLSLRKNVKAHGKRYRVCDNSFIFACVKVKSGSRRTYDLEKKHSSFDAARTHILLVIFERKTPLNQCLVILP